MKRIMPLSLIMLTLLVGQLFIANSAAAAPVRNLPAVVVQPNGDTLHLFLSGDEYYHYLHDARGFVVVRDVITGIYHYAVRDTSGALVPSPYVVGVDNPLLAGLERGVMPSREWLRARHHRFDVPEAYRIARPKTSGINHGRLNNLVIFIRFSDEARVTTQSFSSIESMFNDSTSTAPDAISMYRYFRDDSYGKLSVLSHLLPDPRDNTPFVDSVLSYQDTLPRAYYEPNNTFSNPIGYVDDDERQDREFTLLQSAVNWLNAQQLVPSTLDIDFDNDGTVDNIVFVVSGTYNGWNDLLWPHQWSLYDRTVTINGKRVYTFNLQLAESGSHYFSVSTFCHEMTHTLGAPDLYHYENYRNVSTAGAWDIMHSNQTPPQHTNSVFKTYFLNWLDSIPEITASGTYALLPHGEGANRAVAIPSQDTAQYYILEYRNTRTLYESALPGSGLLVWRLNVNEGWTSNMYYNADSVQHLLWLFRPGSNYDTIDGLVSQAAFGTAGRTEFSPRTNPYPYLCDGTPDTTFSLTAIHTSPDGDTLFFTYEDLRDIHVYDTVYTHVPVTVYDTLFDTLYAPTVYDTLYQSAEQASLLLSVDPATPYGKVSGSGSFPLNTDVEIAAIADRGYRFVRWSDGNEENPRTLTVAANLMLRATFDTLAPAALRPAAMAKGDTARVIHDTVYITLYDTVRVVLHDTVIITPHDTIVLDTTPYYELIVLSGDEGRGVVAGNGTFPEGSQVEIAALPLPGYRFVHWHDNVRSNPRTVLMDEVHIFVAEFIPDTGSVEPDPDPDPEPWNPVLHYGVSGLTVTVTAPASCLIRVFTPDGRLVLLSEPTGDSATESVRALTMPAKGVFLVQVGSFPVKRFVLF